MMFSMNPCNHWLAVIGGGAAGLFAAITCGEARPGTDIAVFEKSSRFLSKVLISGGGRCNVTHACFDPGDFAASYPRGGKELLGPFTRFQARDTVAWFARRGVELKTERDGRIFPVTDSAGTVANCLLESARQTGVRLYTGREVQRIVRAGGRLQIEFASGEAAAFRHVLVAAGGCRSISAARLPAGLGHSSEPPVPSLFSLHIHARWLTELAGVSIPAADVSVPGERLNERGPVLITHEGLSGPAILRLSAWGARRLYRLGYHFPLRLNWTGTPRGELESQLEAHRRAYPARMVAKSPVKVPSRLWNALAVQAGIPAGTRWSELTRELRNRLLDSLCGMELEVAGKSLNKDEFVTCGGVRLSEVDFRTMESRLCPGLYFAGEILDIDGITGGFNFQAAWTTGWIAGQAIAAP